MVVQLLNKAGELVVQANVKCEGEKLRKIEVWRKLYKPKFNECTINVILPEPKKIKEKEFKEKEFEEIVNHYTGKSRKVTKKYGVKGGSSGKKIAAVRASRYW